MYRKYIFMQDSHHWNHYGIASYIHVVTAVEKLYVLKL